MYIVQYRQTLNILVPDSAEFPYSILAMYCTVQANVKYSCPGQRRVPLQYTGYVQYRKNVKYSCPGQRWVWPGAVCSLALSHIICEPFIDKTGGEGKICFPQCNIISKRGGCDIKGKILTLSTYFLVIYCPGKRGILCPISEDLSATVKNRTLWGSAVRRYGIRENEKVKFNISESY